MKIIEEIFGLANVPIDRIQRLTGGDINAVFKVSSREFYYVIKLNTKVGSYQMFLKESNGLEELRNANAFQIPKVNYLGEMNGYSYLIMEYLNEGTKKNWQLFGSSLAQLHTRQQEQFGFYENNYIGSLEQYNEKEENAIDFYINQHLEPQFRIAANKNYQFRQLERFYTNISKLIPNEPASLIHGDLWSGNYLYTEKGFALIDPAVSYSIREMDLAMMKLFGGFPDQVFQTYEEIYPTETGFEKRIPLWQLYYLLVHLNLFGSGYYHSVKNCIKNYL